MDIITKNNLFQILSIIYIDHQNFRKSLTQIQKYFKICYTCEDLNQEYARIKQYQKGWIQKNHQLAQKN
ncbi:hypothetical protein TTHERM_000377389 (macronuclear) [Tetrahymena thermophila SB210]|uniref:Uncharacterized protein n=1 Tax=Tetrahymena thermophila (strain SB210) TaxID=312017 RepID=W7XK02_TETTS|nr:hypothetical protein TTHERM_000377389 [Tetrahymena thermophila SB210]EWS74479.1 hypothetical protein TTHERM_000377389 [Tetrahymena thermophila SB210]|eukprot:XP_012652964.1 hypothetical protein TTHERM_000377389 [Tetrahymena thermophila SB210]